MLAGMQKTKMRFRRPTPDEQTVLREMSIKLLVRPEDIARCDQLLIEQHYLHSSHLVGEHLRYALIWKGQWLAVATWSAAAFHLKARDRFIGWTDNQRRERLPLLVNNSRLWVLPDSHYPNLVSRFMKLMLGRLSADWQDRWKHPVVLAESFVDPEAYRGTGYKVSGWSQLGHTRGWKRSAVDFYQPHDRPKQVWIRQLVKNACVKLRAPQLPPDWVCALSAVPIRCTAKAKDIGSLMERLGREIPEFRRKQGLAYPIAGMLALIAMAVFSGVTKGYEDLADYAATLSQAQLRALKFRLDPHTRRVRHPERTTFERVLNAVDNTLLEQVLLLWQEQVLGPVQDRLVILDGKAIRHADVESVSAVSGTGRWLGSTLVAAESNEIPAARDQLAKMEIACKTVLADAAHTQVETVQQILYEQGGDYVLTVKENQKTLFQTLETLLAEQRFSPTTHAAHTRREAREQPGPSRNPGSGLSRRQPADGGLPGRADDCAAAATGSPQGQENDRDRLSD
jgi:predicted transposase YbfD/YdcC